MWALAFSLSGGTKLRYQKMININLEKVKMTIINVQEGKNKRETSACNFCTSLKTEAKIGLSLSQKRISNSSLRKGFPLRFQYINLRNYANEN